jgi:actin-related protein
MATTDSSHIRTASKSSVSALEAARARIRKDDQSFEPHTPPHRNRSLISSFGSSSSPISSFRNEEDAVIFEIGSRWLRAGFEGESAPMCVVGFGPEESRKVGDYRGWMRSSDAIHTNHRQGVDAESWVRDHELWRMDVREVDLGLVEDKIERAARDIYNKFLLTDAGNARLVLVLPSVMPHPLLSTLLMTLFNRWRFPTITLLPSPAMVAAAAGLRAALVIDIGWAETVVTGIYEHREIEARRSTRAMKSLMQAMGKMLSDLASKDEQTTPRDGISVKFEYCEEVVNRFAWCKSGGDDAKFSRNVSLPLPSNPDSAHVEVPFSCLAMPTEDALFATGVEEHELDDQEQPVHFLVYNTLLALPPDVRGSCMSRIVFVGGGSKIPGVRQRVMEDVAALIAEHGWTSVRGRAVQQERKKLRELRIKRQMQKAWLTSNGDPSVPANGQVSSPTETKENGVQTEEELDFVEQKLRRTQMRDSKPVIQGQFRQIESLGAWAGASLVTSLKIRGLVEIEREKFLQHGLASASRDLDNTHHIPDRRSGFGAGAGRPSGAGDRSSWTLAGWGI